MSAPKMGKIAESWTNMVSTELEGLVKLTEAQIQLRVEKISENVTGLQSADTSIANPRAVIEALAGNANIILANTFEAAGHTPPEENSPTP